MQVTYLLMYNTSHNAWQILTTTRNKQCEHNSVIHSLDNQKDAKRLLKSYNNLL